MGASFDVRKVLEIDRTEPVELRICHIANLWYKEVQPGRMKNHIDTIYNLFPELVISEVATLSTKPRNSDGYFPEIDYSTNYITAYRIGRYLYQGSSGDVVQIINCLYGSVKSPKLDDYANGIQKRISRELCSDVSKVSGLRECYTRLMAELSPQQEEHFRAVFKAYMDAVMAKPDYRSTLFPFSSERLVIDLNNYFSEEFNRGNNADAFLWLNLGALLRNEINDLIDRYDSSFNLSKEAGNPTGKLKEELEHEKENHDLLLRIFENDRKNHPSIRMMDPDPQLFPKGLPEIFSDGRFAVEEEEVPRALRDMILDSWKCEDRRHILLVGEGGIGKTVAMLTLPEEDWFKKFGIPVIYVPLQRLDAFKGDLNRYIREKIGSDNYEHCIELANSSPEEHPRLLLLLDGFNEIPDNYKKDTGNLIRGWMEKPGIQIITTSRLGFFLENSFSKYRLRPLPYDTVRSFLLSAEIAEEQLPRQSDKIWEVINVPLMLAMYTQIEKVKNAADRSSAASILEWKEPDNAAHIIWDYLQMELYRCIEKCIGKDDSNYSIMQYAAAILAIAPYICCRMSYQYKFYIKMEEFHGLIREALNFYAAHQNLLSKQMTNLRRKYDRYREEDLFRNEEAAEYARILIDNLALFQEQETDKEKCGGEDDIDYIYSLMHQNFRDALAAFYICSCLPKTSDAKEKRALLDQADHYVKDYMAEYLSDRELVSIWERHRKEEPEDGHITFMLMDLIGRQRNYDYRELDFSGIDLTKTNLHRLLSKRLDISPLPINRKNLNSTKISVDCLLPKGNSSKVNSVAFSPDGRQLASGAEDSTVQVWDLESGEGRILKGHTKRVRSVAFSPDGRQLASGADDFTVRIWDLESGECRVLKGHAGRIWTVAYSPDGRQVASGDEDGTVQVCDLDSGERHVLKGHEYSILSVAFSPDGRQLASGDELQEVRIWDLESGESHILKQSGGILTCVAFSLDGRLLAGGFLDGTKLERTVCVWNLESGKYYLLEGYTDEVRTVAFSPDGRQLASGANDRTIWVWDLESGESRVLEGHAGRVNSVAFSLDGRQLASGANDRTVRVWNLESGESRVLKGRAGEVNSVAFSPDGRQMASGVRDCTVRILDLESGESHVLEGHADCVNSVAFSSDGRLLASGANDSTVRIWNLESGESRVLEGHAGEVNSVAFSPGGMQVASGANDSTVRIWNLESGESRVLEWHIGSIWSVAFSPDGRHVTSSAFDCTVRIWDLASGECCVLEGQPRFVNSVVYSPDGRYLAISAFLNKTVWIWNLESGESPVLEGHAGGVNSIAFSPDGSQLASGADDSTIRIWDLDDYREVGKYAIIPHINLNGANFELAIIDNKDKKMLRAAGARV